VAALSRMGFVSTADGRSRRVGGHSSLRDARHHEGRFCGKAHCGLVSSSSSGLGPFLPAVSQATMRLKGNPEFSRLLLGADLAGAGGGAGRWRRREIGRED
jgi:hypothetical protein